MIRLEKIDKTYVMGSETLHVLRAVDLTIEAGEFVAIIGPSGSGKSTLMNVLGCLDRPDSGRYFLEDQDVFTLSDSALASIRNKKIGFVFQSFNLLPKSTALENVEVPLHYAGLLRTRKLAEGALQKVELTDRMHHRPSEMSGGQRQRVAIARAIVLKPRLIFADEPTGNLDSRTGEQIMAIFGELNREGTTIIMVTHEPEIAAHASRVITVRDGVIVSDERKAEAPPLLARASNA